MLDPYQVDPMNSAPALTPAIVSQQIYAANQKGDPTAFLLWHPTPRLAEDWDPGCVSLLHYVSHYASQMGRPPCRWDDDTFANQEKYPTAPHPWKTGIPPTFTFTQLYMCQAPPPSTLLLPSTQTLHCWDPLERETQGLKPYNVAR